MLKRVISIQIIAVIIFTMFSDFCCANKTTRMNRYNVVLVTDSSGSMKKTDPQNNRFEAIDLFVGLLANGGNNVGSVVFSDGVLNSTDLTEMKNKSNKNDLSNSIKHQEPKSWTDIGGGLLKAVDILDKGADNSLPSIIILLSDGNTEMETKEKNAQSQENKEKAMELARSKGIKIYTILLNKGKSANVNELKQIADATGGEFREVSEASDLQNVFDLYYRLIYSTQSIKLVDEIVPASGIINQDFVIPKLGVEEVNIVTFGNNTNCELTDPMNGLLSGSQLDEIRYDSNTFSIIKIEKPKAGNWQITLSSEPGSNIKIFKIYNLDLQVELQEEKSEDEYIKGKPIDFSVVVKENDVIVKDVSRYSEYISNFVVKDCDGNEIYSAKKDGNPADSSGYHFSFCPEDYGTYYISATVENDELNAVSNVATINVGNTAPVVENPIKKHINRWPFLIPVNSTVDLSSAVSDAEDDELRFVVKSSSWMDDEYELNGSLLNIKKYSVSNGSFTIAAYDSMGSFCTFDVKITSTNIGLVMAIVIFGGGLLALIIIVFVLWCRSQKAFMGKIKLENISSGEWDEKEPTRRGKMYLTAFQIGQTGLDKKSHFQATGKNYIYYKSKVPFYNDFTCQKEKKIKIDSSLDIKISPSMDFDKGICVHFESHINS